MKKRPNSATSKTSKKKAKKLPSPPIQNPQNPSTWKPNEPPTQKENKNFDFDLKRQRTTPINRIQKLENKRGEINRKLKFKSNWRLINASLRDWIRRVELRWKGFFQGRMFVWCYMGYPVSLSNGLIRGFLLFWVVYLMTNNDSDIYRYGNFRCPLNN